MSTSSATKPATSTAAPAPQATKSNQPAKQAVPTNAENQGWKKIEAKNLPKIFYSLRKVGPNYEPIRIEIQADGSVSAYALPENMKMIAIERTLDLMSAEAV